MISKHSMMHQGEELYKIHIYIYIYNDPGLTMSYFTASSTKVVHAWNGEKCKMFFEGKLLKEMDEVTED